MLIRINTLNFLVTSVLMGVLVHSFTLLDANYLEKIIVVVRNHARYIVINLSC